MRDCRRAIAGAVTRFEGVIVIVLVLVMIEVGVLDLEELVEMNLVVWYLSSCWE